MKAPFVLRWALAWAALTGQYNEISVATYKGEGVTYRFYVSTERLRRWKRWQEKRRAKKEAALAAAQELADKEAEERDS